MAENRHIEHISGTNASLATNLDNLQIGVQSDGDENLVYKDDDGTLHKVANEDEAASFTTVTATADMIVADAVIHSGDTDTKITFGTNAISADAGGITGWGISTTGMTINPNSVDVDTIINANGAEAMRVDGATGRVSVGVAAPDTLLHIKGASVSYRGQLTIENATAQQITFTSGAATSAGMMAYVGFEVATNTLSIDAYIGAAPTTGIIALAPGGGKVCIGGSAIYLGATPTTANKWRLYDDGTNLLIQRYESSAWVTKSTILSA